MVKLKDEIFLWKVSGKMKWNIFFLLLIQIMQGVCSVYYALILHDLINAAVDKNASTFMKAALSFGALVFLQLVLRALQRFLEEFTKSGLENRFKKNLFQNLLKADYGKMSMTHSAEWMNRLTNDTVVVANGMADILPGISGMLVKMIGAMIAIIVLIPKVVYLIVPGGMFLLFFSTVFRKRMKGLHKKIQEADGNLRVFLQDMLGNSVVVRTYAAQEEVFITGEVRMQAHRSARMKRNHFSNLCNIGFGFVMNGAYVLGAIVCGYGILTDTMSYGTFIAVFQLIGQIQSPFANISAYFPRYYAMLASAERLKEVETMDISTIEARDIEEVLSLYHGHIEHIGMSHISFSYPRRPEEQELPEISAVLTDFSLEISKGDSVAFTGVSGCGKSTVLKIFMCLYPVLNGERYLWVDGEKMPLDASWQRLFAYVPQGNGLMSGTIRDVVSFANPKERMKDEKIWEALHIAGADAFVRTLENALDTFLGERGLGLSEGQMQRLAIARAIFSEHPVLVLDECTSALDEATEKEVLDNLKKLTDKTVLIVTHRPAALAICDKIVAFTESGCRIRKKGKEKS